MAPEASREEKTTIQKWQLELSKLKKNMVYMLLNDDYKDAFSGDRWDLKFGNYTLESCTIILKEIQFQNGRKIPSFLERYEFEIRISDNSSRVYSGGFYTWFKDVLVNQYAKSFKKNASDPDVQKQALKNAKFEKLCLFHTDTGLEAKVHCSRYNVMIRQQRANSKKKKRFTNSIVSQDSQDSQESQEFQNSMENVVAIVEPEGSPCKKVKLDDSKVVSKPNNEIVSQNGDSSKAKNGKTSVITGLLNILTPDRTESGNVRSDKISSPASTPVSVSVPIPTSKPAKTQRELTKPAFKKPGVAAQIPLPSFLKSSSSNTAAGDFSIRLPGQLTIDCGKTSVNEDKSISTPEQQPRVVNSENQSHSTSDLKTNVVTSSDSNNEIADIGNYEDLMNEDKWEDDDTHITRTGLNSNFPISRNLASDLSSNLHITHANDNGMNSGNTMSMFNSMNFQNVRLDANWLELTKRQEDLLREVVTLQTQNNRLSDSRKKDFMTMQDLERIRTSLEMQIHGLKTCCATSNRQLIDKDAEIADLQSQIRTLKTRQAMMQERLATRNTEIQTMKCQVQGHLRFMKQATSSVEQLFGPYDSTVFDSGDINMFGNQSTSPLE